MATYDELSEMMTIVSPAPTTTTNEDGTYTIEFRADPVALTHFTCDPPKPVWRDAYTGEVIDINAFVRFMFRAQAAEFPHG